MPDDKSYKRKSVEIEDEIIEEESEVQAQTSMRLRLIKDIRLNITGKVTSKLYIFSGAGSEVDVDSEDAEHLLDRVRGESCCGSADSPYFEIVR